MRLRYANVIEGAHATQVSFPMVLDCYDYCTPEYQKVLQGPRGAENAIEEHKAGIAKRQKLVANAKVTVHAFRACFYMPSLP